jgi:hypothetical protein
MALTAGRVEDAEGVAKHQVALRETGKLFVAASEVGTKMIRRGFGQWLGILDHIVYFRLCQAGRKVDKP